MYYKVIKDGKVIDVLDTLLYVKYNMKHKTFLLTDINDAQGILSSNGDSVWHVNYLLNIPVDGYDTVKLEEIDKFEYDKLKAMNLMSFEEIIDFYNLLLLERGIL